MNILKTQYQSWSTRRRVLSVFLGVLVLIVIVLISILFQAERIINKHLSDFIYEKTDGTYRLEFESLDIDFKHRELNLYAIQFHPDSLKVKANPTQFSLFEANQIQFKDFEFLNLLKTGNLKASMMQVVGPRFFVGSGESASMKSIVEGEVKLGDTFDLPLIHELILDTVRIRDAHLAIDSLLQNSNILSQNTKISIELHHFKLGGIKQTNIPFIFDVKDIFLNFMDLSGTLGDGLHQLKAKEVSLSLLRPIIYARQVQISPIISNIQAENTQYFVNLPEIEMNCPGIEHFLASDSIDINSFEMVRPQIRIQFGTQTGKGTPLNQIDLFALVSHKYKQVTIDSVHIRNSNVYLMAPLSRDTAQSFINLNVDLQQFVANNHSMSDLNRIFFSESMQFRLDTFLLDHSDHIHRLTMSDITMDSKQGTITTGNVDFSPKKEYKRNTNANIVDVSSHGLSMTGVDFNLFYHKQKLSLSQLNVDSPITKLQVTLKDREKEVQKNTSFLFEKTRDYLQGIYVNQIVLTHGKLSYNYTNIDADKGFFKTKFSFKLQKFSLDSTTFYQSDRVFYAQGFDLKFTEIELELADKLHRLTIDSLKLSSTDKLAQLYHLRVNPLSKAELSDSILKNRTQEKYHIHFPYIVMSEANLHSALFDKTLNISEIKVFDPSIKIERDGRVIVPKPNQRSLEIDPFPLIEDYVDRITIGKAIIENGVFTFSQKQKGNKTLEFSNQFGIQLYGFDLYKGAAQIKDRLLFSDHIDLKIFDYSITLPDGIHAAQVKEILIDSKKNLISLKNVLVKPVLGAISKSQLPISYQASIPLIQLSGSNMVDVLYENKLIVKQVLIDSPTVELLFHVQNEKKKVDNKLRTGLPEELRQIDVEHVILKNGKVKLSNYKNNATVSFAQSGIEMEFWNCILKNDKNKLVFNYSNAKSTLTGVSYQSPEGSYQLKMNELKFMQMDSILNISNLQLIPNRAINEKSSLNVTIPQVKLTGFNLAEMQKSKNLKGRILSFSTPALNINSGNTNETFNLLKPLLFKEISEVFNSIAFDRIELRQADIDHSGSKGYHFLNVDLTLYRFLLNAQTDQQERYFYSDQITGKIPKLNGKSAGGFYEYSINDLKFSSLGDISIGSSSFKPVYSREKFFKLKQFQDDYVTLVARDATIKGFDFKSWFNDRSVTAKNVEVHLDVADFYRDKRLSIAPEKRTKLPQQMLRELKMPLQIDSASIYFNKLVYSELELGALSEGSIFIDHAKLQANNLTNIPSKFKKNRMSLVKFNGQLMGAGTLDLEMHMNLIKPDNSFSFKGHCGSMELSKLNSITEPSLKFSIKEGMSQDMDVFFEANEDSAQGSIRFAYSDLKVMILNYDRGVRKEEKLVSFLANKLAIKSDNPKPGRVLLPESIDNKRDKQRSVVNYIWKSIFDGIKETFGMKDKEPK